MYALKSSLRQKLQSFLKIMLLPVAAMATTGCNSVHWQYDYSQAATLAANGRCRTVVYFATASNPECREMDWKVWPERYVRELMREFVAVRQDFYLNHQLAAKLGVTEVPAVVVLRPDGTVAGIQTGLLTPEALRIFLIKNRFN